MHLYANAEVFASVELQFKFLASTSVFPLLKRLYKYDKYNAIIFSAILTYVVAIKDVLIQPLTNCTCQNVN